MKRIIILLILTIQPVSFYGNEIDAFMAVSTFSQNNKNCASIALIKAAMLRYGYNKVIQYERHANAYNVILRDDSHISITEEELMLTKKSARFTINQGLSEKDTQEVMLQAYLLYACIAKKVQFEGYYGCEQIDGTYYRYDPVKKYNKALRFISRTSFCTDKCYTLLGLDIKGEINDFTEKSNLDQNGTILYSKGHAVAVYQGKADYYGEWKDVKDIDVQKQQFKWFIILK